MDSAKLDRMDRADIIGKIGFLYPRSVKSSVRIRSNRQNKRHNYLKLLIK